MYDVVDEKIQHCQSHVEGNADECPLLENNANRMSGEEKLSLGPAILTHGIIIAKNPTIKVPQESLQMFSNLDNYSVRPWGKMGYEVLSASIRRMKAKAFAKPMYEVQGFVWAITLWALSAVPALGTTFVSRYDSSSSAGPLCLQWKATQTPNISEVLDVHNQRDVIVNTVVGDPEEYKNLVPPTNPIDKDFATVVQLVMEGYRLSRSEWIEGKVDGVLVSEQIRTQHNRRAEPSRTTREAPLVTDTGKIDKIMEMLKAFIGKVETIEAFVGIKAVEKIPKMMKVMKVTIPTAMDLLCDHH
ncbi:unnamed protein product [Thlaspi arvense]|uniref:Uncharacterized protein n=1 Tax=Thlaspi arvense TaxID=13288 RepID=A0AAU9R8U7_THLAR|nr:unnamed protein product [Thlaspi arvense]